MPAFLIIFLFTQPGPEVGVYKAIQFAIQYGISITGLILSSVVLDHLIRLEDIASNLITPASGDTFSLELGPFFSSLSHL